MTKSDLRSGQLWVLTGPAYKHVDYYTFILIIDASQSAYAHLAYYDAKTIDNDCYMPVTTRHASYDMLLGALSGAPYGLISGPGAEK